MITDFLLFVFVGVVCIWAWDYIHREKDDSEIEIVGTLLVLNDGEEAYLFLDTDMKPEEFANRKEVIFKVETPNQQAPL